MVLQPSTRGNFPLPVEVRDSAGAVRRWKSNNEFLQPESFNFLIAKELFQEIGFDFLYFDKIMKQFVSAFLHMNREN